MPRRHNDALRVVMPACQLWAPRQGFRSINEDVSSSAQTLAGSEE
jgi:hypothetical protein